MSESNGHGTMEIKEVAISDIRIGTRHRRVREDAVADIAESITQIGLLNPVVLTEQFDLIAGAHRIGAVKTLGWITIPAHVRAFESLKAELAEIDENLRRNELTVLEHGEHLARRKEIYEGLHPEAKQGSNG